MDLSRNTAKSAKKQWRGYHFLFEITKKNTITITYGINARGADPEAARTAAAMAYKASCRNESTHMWGTARGLRRHWSMVYGPSSSPTLVWSRPEGLGSWPSGTAARWLPAYGRRHTNVAAVARLSQLPVRTHGVASETQRCVRAWVCAAHRGCTWRCGSSLAKWVPRYVLMKTVV